jgi:MFS family permease
MLRGVTDEHRGTRPETGAAPATAPGVQDVRGTFAALEVPNFRRYFFGQIVSLVGTWMQSIALPWLVLELTHSATEFGLVVAVQFLPIMAFSAYGGLVVDRLDKRRLLFATQAAQGFLALVLGLLTVTHVVRIWMLVVVALGMGVAGAVDTPARQAFVVELVGRDHLRNAVTLNSVTVNSARAVGPAVAALVIAVTGVSACFFVNAVSFAAVILALCTLDKTALRPVDRTVREPGQLREGLEYVRGNPELRTPILMMVLVGTVAYEFPVTLALLAKQTFHGGAGSYSFLTVALGAGAVCGGIWVAGRRRTGLWPVALATGEFGIMMLTVALAPNLGIAIAALVLAGVGYIAFNAIGNSTLQLACAPAMRGRVMGLWAMWFQGSTLIGSPLVGYIAQHAGARWAIAAGGFAGLVACGTALLTLGLGPARSSGLEPLPASNNTTV